MSRDSRNDEERRLRKKATSARIRGHQKVAKKTLPSSERKAVARATAKSDRLQAKVARAALPWYKR